MRLFLSLKKSTVVSCLLGLGAFLILMSGVSPALEQKPIKIDKMDFDVAKSLKEREENVRLQEENLKIESEKLAAVKKEIEDKLTKLVKMQLEVEAKLTALNNSTDSQFKNLVKVYSAMSTSKAAPLLNKMEDEIVVQILRAMKADLVSKIIPKLDPDKAVSVSKKLGMLNTKIGQ